MTVRPVRVAVVLTLACALAGAPLPAGAQPQAPPPAAPPGPQQPAPQQPAQPRRITAIEIRGNTRIPDARILAALTQLKVGEVLTDEKIREDIRAINDLGVFADVTVRPEAEGDGVRVVIIVTENPVVREVVIEGNTVVPEADIRQALGVPVGEVLNLNRMREGTRAVQKLYEDRGYVLARVTDTAIVPLEGTPDQARLRVRIAEGTVEAVRFEGLRKTRLSTALRHIQETQRGKVFNVQALNRDLQRLFDTGLFDTLRARPEPGSAPDSAVVVIEVTEARTAQIGGGLGYSSRDGLIGFVEYRDRNWRGLGQTFAARAERSVSSAQRFNYEVSFTEPFLDPLRTSLDLGLYSRSNVDQEYSGGTVVSRFELLRTGATVSLSRPLDPATSLSARFKSERTDITALPIDPADPNSAVVAPSSSLLTPGRVVSFGLSGTRDTRDDRFKPTKGERLAFSADVGLRFLGGDFGFTKYVVDYQRLFPAGRSVVVGRVLFGAASGTLPSQEQFLLGGSSTVRALPAGRYRGSSIVVFNAEYRFPLGTLIKQLGEMTGIVFLDAGSAPAQLNNLAVGYGVGVALSTPLGPIRLDLAFGPEGRQTWLSLGAPF